MNQVEYMLQEKTEIFLSSLYMHDIAAAIQMMDEKIILAGLEDKTFCSGVNEAEEYLERFLEGHKGIVREKEYQCIDSEQDIGFISLHYNVAGVEKGEICCRRASFFWSRKDEVWKIVHVHLNDIDMGEEKVLVHGKQGCTYLLHIQEIMFIEARNMNSEIHCRTQTIVANEQLAAFRMRLPRYFVKVHRSYLVNVHYVEKVERYQIRLHNGSLLPVPEKRYKEVKEKVKELIEEWPAEASKQGSEEEN